MSRFMWPAAVVLFALPAGLGCVSAGCSGGSALFGPDGGVFTPDGGESPAEAGTDAAPDAPHSPPPATKPLTVFGAYAVNQLFLGETGRNGAPLKDAWKTYGENLDGLVSTKVAQGECKLVAGANSATRIDGVDGIDNAFGKTVLEFTLGLAPAPTKTANDAILAGSRTTMFNLLPSPSRFGFLSAEAVSTAPTFQKSSVRAAVAATVNGAPDKALSVSTTPGMTDDDVILSGPASGTFYLEIPISFDSGGPAALWRIPLRHARVTMTVAGSYASGTISGIAATEELVAELEKVAGRISTQLCGGSTLDTMKQTIRQASDILVDGTQDPTKDCNGVSFGIGFSAKPVTLSGVAPAPAAGPDPCNP